MFFSFNSSLSLAPGAYPQGLFFCQKLTPFWNCDNVIFALWGFLENSPYNALLSSAPGEMQDFPGVFYFPGQPSRPGVDG
jgi:hypothetical protein